MAQPEVPESEEFTSRCLLYFDVDDIDAEHARLVAADVPFVDKPHIVHRDGGTQLWMTGFKDPDGTPWCSWRSARSDPSCRSGRIGL